jgi:hypothetical protein
MKEYKDRKYNCRQTIKTCFEIYSIKICEDKINKIMELNLFDNESFFYFKEYKNYISREFLEDYNSVF